MSQFELTRRGLLGATGGLALSDAVSRLPVDRDTRAGDGRQDFLYLDIPLFENTELYRNFLAYARRHDLAVVLSLKAIGGDAAVRARPPLEMAAEWGVEAWLMTGNIEGHFTAESIATSESTRSLFLEELGAVVERYREFFPEGKLLLWHEVPQGGNWVSSESSEGPVPEGAVENFLTHGPTIFASEKRHIRDLAPDVDVGIFPHYSTLVGGGSERVTGTEFGEFMASLRDADALPDFTFCDLYRGYVEPTAGVTAANDTLNSLLSEARAHTDGRPVFYLGQDHTLQTGYTPSRQAMRESLHATRSASPAGLGWYAITSYFPTRKGFDPFVPNVDPGPRKQHSNTFTRSRDRFQYAYRLLAETRDGFDPAGHFDLWLDGEEFGFHDHRLSARRADTGDWEFVGDFAGYVSGAGPAESSYSGAEKRHVSIFHGLSRDRYVDSEGSVALRIETDPKTATTPASEVTPSSLRNVFLMPFDTGNYVSEMEARSLVETHDIAPYALGATAADTGFGAGDDVRLEVEMGEATRRFGRLLYPDFQDLRASLADAEANSSFAARDRFDLWVGGRLDSVSLDAVTLRANGEQVPLSGNSIAAASTADAAVFYGLGRELLSEPFEVETGGDASVERVYAMPYFGRDNFKPPTAVASILAETDAADIASFSLDPAAATTTTTTPTVTSRADGTTAPGTDGFRALPAVGAVAAGALLRLLSED